MEMTWLHSQFLEYVCMKLLAWLHSQFLEYICMELEWLHSVSGVCLHGAGVAALTVSGVCLHGAGVAALTVSGVCLHGAGVAALTVSGVCLHEAGVAALSFWSMFAWSWSGCTQFLEYVCMELEWLHSVSGVCLH